MSLVVCEIKIMLFNCTEALYKLKLEIYVSTEPSVLFYYPSVDFLGESRLRKKSSVSKPVLTSKILQIG